MCLLTAHFMMVFSRWWAASLQHVHLVVFADLDLQLMRPDQPAAEVAARWRATWDYAVPPSGQPRLLSVSDFSTPLNGGLWTLSWPSRPMYERGLALMQNTTWSSKTGFNGVGSPRTVYARLPHVRRRMRRTQMLKHDTWHFFNGDCDQGFLFYLFYLIPSIMGRQLPSSRLQEGAVLSLASSLVPQRSYTTEDFIGADHESYHGDYNASSAPAAHSARHYWGQPKPWMLAKHNNEARVAYFLNHTDYSGGSVCAAEFSRLAQQLRSLGVSAPRKAPKWSGKLQQLR
jgi:hypothetical protein